jgi:thioredoxin 1
MQYGITGIPALIVFENGVPAKSIVGARPKAVLLSDLAEFIG